MQTSSFNSNLPSMYVPHLYKPCIHQQTEVFSSPCSAVWVSNMTFNCFSGFILVFPRQLVLFGGVASVNLILLYEKPARPVSNRLILTV